MGRALHEGTTSNRYTVLGRLAGGGMADIFLAKATTEGGVERYVVLKRVLAERSRDPHFAKMFLDEARLAAQLQHPNIAQVHDIGKLAGSYFFTMEYVHGEDVRAVLHRLSKQGRTFPISHVLHVAAGALAALEHAHERTGADGGQLGIVHRDVSPSNVMVSFEGVVKLLDFGVAKAAQRTAESQSGTIKGKIAYLSPEQCQGHAVDRRSDIYSLGIVLWEMLAGKRLYKRETDFATMMAIVNEPAPVVSSKRVGVSSAIDRIVMKALAIDPAQRYATAAEMLEAIENVGAKEQHVLSATAVGRFLRELFGGERPKPWLTLKPRETDDQPLTITGESISEIVIEEPSEFGIGSSPQMVSPEDTALVAQLERAPAIRTSMESESVPGPRLPEGTPGARPWPQVRAPIVPETALAVSGTLMPDIEVDDPTSVTIAPVPDDELVAVSSPPDLGNDPTAIGEPPAASALALPIVTVPSPLAGSPAAAPATLAGTAAAGSAAAAPVTLAGSTTPSAIKLPGVTPSAPKLPGVTPMPRASRPAMIEPEPMPRASRPAMIEPEPEPRASRPAIEPEPMPRASRPAIEPETMPRGSRPAMTEPEPEPHASRLMTEPEPESRASGLMAESSPHASRPALLEPHTVLPPPSEVSVAATADAWDAAPGVASVKPRRGRLIAIVLVLLLLGGAAVAFVLVQPTDRRFDPDPIAKAEPQTAPDPEPKPEAAVTPDAAVAPDPVTKPPKPEPPSISALVDREDWNGATKLCAATKSPTRGEQVSCGIAFCRAKKLPLARRYHQLAQADERATIESACKTAGIALVAPQPPPPTRPPPTKPPRPPKPPAGDPCESMADPLKCQK